MIFDHLNENEPVRTLNFTPDQWKIVSTLPLITAKPVIFACNIDAESYLNENGNEMALKFKEYVDEKYKGLSVVNLCSTLESDISEIRGSDGDEVANEFMEMAGLEGSALDALLEECSNILNLQKYYTAGPTEVSSWFMKKGALAPEAAGKIHTKFEKAFICAEICKVDDWVTHKDEDKIRSKGIYKRMGKNYEMEENDVALFHHSLG